jgi:CheY-like chemotaxis protein
MPVVTVLLVDDDADIRAVLVDVLADLGLDVAEVANGAEALEAVARKHPALVLMDLMMPVLDGFEACRRLKADPATRAVPVVGLSAGANRADALGCGCDDFVAKPFDLASIEAVLRRWLPEPIRSGLPAGVA